MGSKKDISKEILILRASAGWTQSEFAKRLDTSQRAIAAWESGKSLPRKAMQVKIAQLFNLPNDYFFDANNDDEDNEESQTEEKALLNKIESIVYGEENNISLEKKKRCIEAIQEIMDITK